MFFDTVPMAMRNFLDFNNLPMYREIFAMCQLGVLITNATLHDPAFQTLLHTESEFDIVLVETFMTEALLGLGHHFKAPVIAVTTFGINKFSSDLVAAPESPSYIPNLYIGYTDRMNFAQRLSNWVRYTLEEIFDVIVFQPAQQKLLQLYPDKDMPSIRELKRNVSLLLVNTHTTLGFPRPYPPNAIDVGGLHIDRDKTSLPENLRQFLDDAKDGAIYLSLGTNLHFSLMAEEKREAILNSFTSFPRMRLLIKSDINLTVPSHNAGNVLVDSWFPQEAVLNHPNIHLFVTHGGLLSTMESVYFGKPVVGIPVFADQHMNMNLAAHKGYGEAVPYQDLNEELIKGTIEKVLLNPRYIF